MIRTIIDILFWRFQRGSWQYDIMCGLILAFIFFTPVSVFDGSLFLAQREGAPPRNILQAADSKSATDSADKASTNEMTSTEKSD